MELLVNVLAIQAHLYGKILFRNQQHDQYDVDAHEINAYYTFRLRGK
jgi:hypothetical protein